MGGCVPSGTSVSLYWQLSTFFSCVFRLENEKIEQRRRRRHGESLRETESNGGIKRRCFIRKGKHCSSLVFIQCSRYIWSIKIQLHQSCWRHWENPRILEVPFECICCGESVIFCCLWKYRIKAKCGLRFSGESSIEIITTCIVVMFILKQCCQIAGRPSIQCIRWLQLMTHLIYAQNLDNDASDGLLLKSVVSCHSG